MVENEVVENQEGVVVETTVEEAKVKKTKGADKEAYLLSKLSEEGNQINHFITDSITKTDAQITLRNMEKRGLCRRVKNDKSTKGFTYFKVV